MAANGRPYDLKTIDDHRMNDTGHGDEKTGCSGEQPVTSKFSLTS